MERRRRRRRKAAGAEEEEERLIKTRFFGYRRFLKMQSHAPSVHLFVGAVSQTEDVKITGVGFFLPVSVGRCRLVHSRYRLIFTLLPASLDHPLLGFVLLSHPRHPYFPMVTESLLKSFSPTPTEVSFAIFFLLLYPTPYTCQKFSSLPLQLPHLVLTVRPQRPCLGNRTYPLIQPETFPIYIYICMVLIITIIYMV